MKIKIQSPDAGGDLNGAVNSLLLHLLPRVTSGQDVTVVPCAWFPGYKFNPELDRLKGPVVLMDFLEFGWNYGDKENRLGHGTEHWPEHLKTEDWKNLDAWVKGTKIPLTFQRELKLDDVTPFRIPIEFPNEHEQPRIQTKDEFMKRPVEVSHIWGWSHPDRVSLHSDIFWGMTNRGYEVVDNLDVTKDHFTKAKNRTWVSCYTPWYSRYTLEQVQNIYGNSKICCALPGAGVKTFRHSEIINSIMAKPADNLAWAYPWTKSNSIILDRFNPVEILDFSTKEERLYETYVNGCDNMNHYRSHNYINNYILPAIQDIL